MLIFLPFLGALVCLIARGRGMSESQMADVRRAQSETNAYLKQGGSSLVGGTIYPSNNVVQRGAM